MSPRALKIALALSLAVNLLVLGAVAGALIAGGPPGRDGGPRTEMGALTRGLDGPARRDLARTLRRDPQVREGRQRLREAAAATRAALTADPFDREALRDAMRDRQTALALMGERGAEAFANAVAELSPEARAALAARMTRRGAPRD
ncbi:periplasmic heavy metal sensor [Jannaschia ovalis]|uniref:Periplasmic heavy metal sensor n=1 Tax=Jannaschia ovalis TaxID=3038773 RepID=A0ABY8LCJ3_9RHOB|nr:periplasmic heavy metal sensor [Jannaschia sp. GRR-S6-38]WGH77908.1 periplasmic heavy metal sensor [Jannaschia sp. GRR-S6-38]